MLKKYEEKVFVQGSSGTDRLYGDETWKVRAAERRQCNRDEMYEVHEVRSGS